MTRQPRNERRGTGKEVSPLQQAAYELGFRQAVDRPARRQTTTTRSVRITEDSLTITEQITYTEDF